MSGPIPIVLCGASSQIATGVKNGLLPEIEVIHVILSAEAGAAEIPLLLEGKSLPSGDNVGSQNCSKKPVAVVTGGGYDDARFKLMKDACEGKGGVSWLRPDMGSPIPPLGPQYGAIMVDRIEKGMGGSLSVGSWVKMEYLYIDEQDCLICRRWLTVVLDPLNCR